MPVAVNQTELRLIGMSRSGNHAIAQWILAQATGRVCFLNAAEGRSNPFLTARPMDDGPSCWTNIPGFDLAAEQRGGAWSAKDLLMFSHEDGFLARSCSEEFERSHDAFVGPSRRRVDVLILRDPFNLFASRRKCLWGVLTPRTTVKVWKQHAREFLRPGRFLRHDPLVISYNRWCVDRDYRRGVAQHLGLAFTDAGRDRVWPCNGGSSFDGRAYDGRAAAMRVFDRWRHYAEDPSFRQMFDPEVRTLSARIFGPLPRVRPRPRARPRERAHAVP